MFSLPFLEVSRFKRHTLTRLALLTVILIPTVYGGVYLWANWDPTGNAENLKAAVVNLDEGSTDPELDAGNELTDKMTDPDEEAGFDWESTDVDDAAKGLDSGKYTAVMTIPANFSQRLTSTSGDDPERTELKLQTNDANNYIVGKVGSTILSSVRENLNETTTAKYVKQVYVGFNDIHKNMVKAADSADELHDGTGQLDDGAGKLGDGADELHDATGQAVTGAGTLHDGLVKLDLSAGKLADGAGTLAKNTGTLANGADSAHDNAKKLAKGADQLSDGTGQLRTQADKATTSADDFKDRADGLIDSTAPKIDRAANDFEKNRDTVRGDVADRLAQLEKRYPDDPDVKRLVKDADRVGDDLDDAHDRARAGYDKAKHDGKDARNKADQVVGAVHKADRAVGKLDDGARTVAKGNDQLADGLGTLSTGAHKLDKGADTLASGASKLDDATGKAASGAKDLADGAEQLDDGAGKLATNADKLHKASGKVDDGAGELASGIRDGAKEVPTYDKDDRDDRSSAVALPVTGDDSPKNKLGVYGEGMAPMFVNIGLWIGGMITYMVLGAMPYRALATSAKSYRIVLAGWIPGAVFGCLQALVLYAFLAFFLDFTVSSWLGTLLFSFLITASFHAIHQMCVVLFGGIGRLLALVLLILQLGAGSGTYPVETAPAFFQAIAPFLPMTYAISGLRAIVAGGEPSHVLAAIVGLVVIGLAGLVVSTLGASAKRMIKLKDLHPSFTL